MRGDIGEDGKASKVTHGGENLAWGAISAVTRHYPLQRQLEHGTTNRLSLHLLIRHIMLSNHLLHSATCTPPSATFWKLYLPEELSPSARTSIRCKPNLYLLDTIFT